MNVSKLCAVLSLVAACSSQAQVTVSYDNFNFRGGTGSGGFGIFGTPGQAGDIVTQDGTPYSTGQYTPVTEFEFRWDGLTLDSAGSGDDYIDFTLRITSNGATAGNVQLGGEGIGVAGGLGIRIDEDDVNTTEDDESEALLIEVVDISLSDGTLGTVVFDGFTEAFAFAAAGGGGIYDVEADINGTTGLLSRNGSGYIFGNLAPAWTGAASPTLTVNNTVYNAQGQDTAVPRILYRQCDFSFTFTEAAGAPTILEFSLSDDGFGTGESQGSYFTSGTPSNTASGVFDQASLEFFYDLDNVTQAVLKRDGIVEQTIAISSPAAGTIVPNVQSAGVYEYTLEVTNGSDVATSQVVTVSIEQPLNVTEFSTRSNASQISRNGKLPLFISAVGDFDFDDLSNGLFLAFTDQAESLTEAEVGGSLNDGELTLDYQNSPLIFSDNLTNVGNTGRLDVPIADIIAAIEASNSALSYPFSARAKLSAINPAGTTTVNLDFTILDSQILVELNPESFVLDSNTIDNEYISPFVEALDVANGDIVDLTGNGSVTFTSGLDGGITLAETFTGFGSFQEGYRFQDVTHSLWVEIPETPAGGGLIIKWGNDGVGTSIGIDSGNLTAIMQDSASNFSQASAPVTAGWHHIAATVDIGSPSTISLYLDGVLVSTGAAAAADMTSWANTFTGSLFGNIGGSGFAGQSAGLFAGGGFSNATSGVIRMYNGLLDATTIEALAEEFIDTSAPIAIDSVGFNGDDLEIVASGLVAGTEYFLVQDADLEGGFLFVVDSVVAGSSVETFLDSDPTSFDDKSFYRVTAVDPQAP